MTSQFAPKPVAALQVARASEKKFRRQRKKLAELERARRELVEEIRHSGGAR